MDISKNYLDNILPALKNTVIKSSLEIMKVYNSDDLGRKDKGDGSPVTIADLAANEVIMRDLKAISPEIPIISEETYSNDLLNHNHKLFWIVDPLDGTREFINKSTEFTVNIGLIRNGKPIFGIVGAPFSGEIWSGSVFDIEKTEQEESYTGSSLRIVMSKSHQTDVDKSFLDFLRLKDISFSIIEKGSSLKICSLATGEADFYPRFGPTSEWDIAAAEGFLRSKEGLIVKAKDFSDLSYGKTDSILNPPFFGFRNNDLKDKFMPILSEFTKKLL